jgi:putative sterol carrier protein
MVYFLGRDVVVALTTEDADDLLVSTSGAVAREASGAYSGATIVAGPRKDNAGTGTTVFGTQTDNSKDYSNEIASLTSCDLSIGATDEDVVYFGQRTTLKAEIKKETSVTLTRKKEDNAWDVLFDGARSGMDAAGTGIRNSLAGAPDDVNYGYRIYVKLKNAEEIFVLRNCCVTGHSVSLSADGITEETLELMSYVDPLIKAADADCLAATGATDL